MFGPTARGERPLRSRLHTSIGNYCVDLVRGMRRERPHQDSSTALANAPAPEDRLPTYQQIQSTLGRQMAAVRQACPLRQRPDGAAYREALLLRLRLDWAGAFDGTILPSETGGEKWLTLELLETVMVWTEEERAMPLVEIGPPLEQLWQQVRTLLLAAPRRELTWRQFVPLIPTIRVTWNQWISRGRRNLSDHLGEEYGSVFAIWSGKGDGA
jgi:hypothetical protein